ncbi:MAG: zinc-dependent metalloprotease, partial [Bacteriovoracaceae bacterium]|nr:zinc-dependent metalloprotease [Bacteriovoracaceae bacterium]
MKVNEERSLKKTMMGLLFVASLFVGCAKELPEDVSDDIIETAHSLDLFKSTAELETVQEDGILALSSKDEVSDIIAVNELGLRNVKMVGGNPELAPFFEGLKLESSTPGEKFTVHFAFTSSALVAYAEVKSQRLTVINEQLSETIKTFAGKTVRAYPIFQYSVQAFGALEKAENALGEQTRTVLFKPKAMSSATHIKIDPKAEKRKHAAFRFNEIDDVKVVFDKQKISKRLFKTKDIIKLFNYSSEVEANSTIGKDDFLRMSVLKDLLVIQVPVKKSTLTDIELAALESAERDPRIKMCDKTIAQASKIAISVCVLKPLYSVKLTHIKLKKKYEEGVLLAQMDSPASLNKMNLSKLIEIDLDSRLTDATIGKDINNVDEILTSKNKHFDLDAEYLYVPMTMGTPREVIAADPFYQGKEKIVKMRFAKDGLEIYELEKDGRFTDNDLNNTPVLKVPGAHIDYKCKQDENDECVGGDVVDTDKEWNEKRFFKPSLYSLNVLEINPLDVMTVEADSCLRNVSTELVDYTIKKGVLNIELEKTYKTSNSWRCIAEHYFADTENMTGFSQAGFKVRFFYSVVKLESLASKDYEPVAYPIPDHDEFGFFKDKISKLNGNFDSQRKENNYLLNRWNPKKKVITYHLSDTFNKPKNKLIKDATYKAFEGMNKSLKLANAGFELELKEPSGKKSGDLRNSMIVLIDDPLSNGLLGYAPTVTNPRTGEIVQGHVNMYSGVLTSIVRHTWEGMVDFTIKKAAEEKRLAEKSILLVEEKAKSEEKESDEDKESKLKKITNKKLLQKALAGGNQTKSSLFGNFYNFNIPTNKAEKLKKNAKKAKLAMERRLHEKFVWNRETDRALSEMSEFERRAHKHERRLQRFAENNALSAEAYKIAHTTKELLPGVKEMKNVFKKDGILKRWSELTEAQRKIAVDLIVPYTYTATLVHEVGHGLGLRHNFIASKDAANYWTEEEAKALGLSHAPAYSSVMDYAFDPLNESTVFGKYDIAALRFGYAREVELNRAMTNDGTLPEDVKDKEFVKIETSLYDLTNALDAANEARSQGTGEDTPVLEEKLASYQFCTDSNAGLSASCNRFDEGSTLVEIVNHYIDKYETYYRYRNFRDGRNTFQAEGLGGYTIARYHEFNRIRGIFEEWEFFASIFGADLMAQGCGPAELALYPICKDINERRDSVKIAGDFFLKVLKMPDHTCALAKADAPTKVVELRTLSKIYDDVKFSIKHVTKSCFDPAVKKEVAGDNFVVVGEAGKFLNGFKDNSPIHIYSNDRA